MICCEWVSRMTLASQSLTLSLVATCLLHFKLPVFSLKALKGSVPRPLSSPAHSKCFLLCQKWSLCSLLYLSAVMTLLTPIRTSVTTYLPSQNEKLSLQGVPHIDPFNGIISHFCWPCLVFTKINPFSALFTYFFISCLFLSYILLYCMLAVQ